MGFSVSSRAEDAVSRILGVARDKDLGAEDFLALDLDFEVDMRGTAGISDGFDGAESVGSGGVGFKCAKSLEIRVAAVCAVRSGVDVYAVAIDLPDFDCGVFDGCTRSVSDFSREVGDLPERGDFGAPDKDEVIVFINGHFVGIKRPFGNVRSCLQEVLVGAGFGETEEFFFEYCQC